MVEETLHRRGTTLVRRLRLAPGETTPWHRDPFHRVTVVLAGDALAIEYRDRGPGDHFELTRRLIFRDKLLGVLISHFEPKPIGRRKQVRPAHVDGPLDIEHTLLGVTDMGYRVVILIPMPPDREIRSPLKADVVPVDVPGRRLRDISADDGPPHISVCIFLRPHDLKHRIAVLH